MTHKALPFALLFSLVSAPAQACPDAPNIDVDSVTCQETACKVPQAVVDAVSANPAGAFEARAVPAIRDGKSIGFKLYGLRKGTLLYRIGLRTGDLVTTVNGTPVRTVDDALATYVTAMSAKILVVDVERRGENIEFTLTVVP